MVNRKKISFLILAMAAGFIGGFISNQIFRVESAFAVKEDVPKKVIIAEEFRVVDDLGKTLATLKFNGEGNSGLWLYSRNGELLAELSTDPIKRKEFEEAGEKGKSTFEWSVGTHLWLFNRGRGQFGDLSIKLNTDRTNGGLKIESRNRRSELNDSLMIGEQLILRGIDPKISLINKKDRKIVIGSTDLKDINTGSIEKRSTTSVIFFDEKGKVIWSAP